MKRINRRTLVPAVSQAQGNRRWIARLWRVALGLGIVAGIIALWLLIDYRENQMFPLPKIDEADLRPAPP